MHHPSTSRCRQVCGRNDGGEDDKNRRRLTLDSSKDLTSSAAAAAFLPPDLAKTTLILGSTLDFQISMAAAHTREAIRQRKGHDSYGREQQQQQHRLAAGVYEWLQIIRGVDAAAVAVLMAARVRRPRFIGLAAATRAPALRGICGNATARAKLLGGGRNDTASRAEESRG
jgi:hypothetical protein